MKKFAFVCFLVCMCLLSWSSQNVSAYTWVDRGWTDPISMPKTLGGVSYNDYAWFDAGGGWSTILFYNTDGDQGCTPYHNLYLGSGMWSNYGVYGSCHWLRMDCNPVFSHCTSDDYSSGISSDEAWGGSFLGFSHSTRDVMKSKADLGDYTPYGISNQVYQAKDRNGAVKLIININPLDGGNVTGSGISCNVETSSSCQYYFQQGSQVSLTANANCNWVFGSWYDGTLSSTTNPLTITMDSDKTLTAKFLPILKWPLSGTKSSRTILLGFGEDWLESCGGQVMKHAGIDIQATEGETVYAAESGIVKAALTDSQWGGWVTLEHGSMTSYPHTTAYIHIIPSVSYGTPIVKGDPIGTVVNYGGPLHLHFGIREGLYSNTSNRGRLPQTSCGGDPAFRENFVDPQLFTYE